METITHPLNLDVEEIPTLTPRAAAVLATRGISTVRQLAAIRPQDFRGLTELSVREQQEVRNWMEQQRLWLPLWETMPKELYDFPVEQLPGLGARTIRSLGWAKLTVVGDLVRLSWEQLYVLSNMSHAGAVSVRRALQEKGLYLR